MNYGGAICVSTTRIRQVTAEPDQGLIKGMFLTKLAVTHGDAGPLHAELAKNTTGSKREKNACDLLTLFSKSEGMRRRGRGP